VTSIGQAAAEADVVLFLIPDEVMPTVFEQEVEPGLKPGDALVFASGYTIAFGLLQPPEDVDVVLVAPRMIGQGVRDHYVAGSGFPSFIGVERDHTGRARAVALAIAKGIGSTRAGVVEVSFAEEAELDLFTEQCFGPAFGRVLTTAVELLLEEGYPPEAVLLELYMSGELAYTMAKIAEMGIVEQSQLHSRTSQYGSMTRGMRFQLPGLREKMLEGLEEIRSGAFAREWEAEQEEGAPTLEMLKASARSLPLYGLERELREALRGSPGARPQLRGRDGAHNQRPRRGKGRGLPQRLFGLVGKIMGGGRRVEGGDETLAALPADAVEPVLRRFVALAVDDAALRGFAEGRVVTTHYVLQDADLGFYLSFAEGRVTGGVGTPPAPAEVRLEMDAVVLDGMLTGTINAARAAMSGKVSFEGDTRRAMTVQRIQGDLTRLYRQARREVLSPG
jgi:ketol-acid reductoisomerase